MKDSAWYHKLWRKKLTELPVKEDAGSAWADMKNVLDTQMPVNSGTGHTAGPQIAKSLVTKIATLMIYVLPAAAMVGTAAYFTVPLISKQKHTWLKEKHSHHLTADTLDKKSITPEPSDSTLLNNAILSKNDSIQKVSAPYQPKEDRGIEKSKNNNQSANTQLANQLTVTSKSSNATVTDPKIADPQVTNRTKDNQKEIADRTAGYTAATGNQYPLSNNINLKTALLAQGSTAVQKNNILHPVALPGKLKTAKNKAQKSSRQNNHQKNKTKKSEEIITPLFDYGLEAGWNKGNKSSFYAGIFGTYRLQTRWLLNAGVRMTSETLSGSYTSSGVYYFPDSLQPFKVTDKRNLLILSIPLTLEYRISKMISLNVGPVISFPAKQSNISYQVGTLLNQRDTTSVKGKSVDTTLKRTVVNKINLGITGGISVRIKQFYLDARYQQNLSPYTVTSDLGSYQQKKGSVQLGIRYKFKK